MKKIMITIAVFLLIAGSSMGQKSQTVTKGADMIGVGFGPGRVFNGPVGFAPAFRLHYEHGTFNAGPGVITLGGTFGYAFHANPNSGTWSTFGAGVRSAWHCSWGIKKLDTYAGLAAGMRFEGFKKKYDSEPKPDFAPVSPYFGGFVGAAYYFHPQVGVFVEGGYDISHATIGLDFLF